MLFRPKRLHSPHFRHSKIFSQKKAVTFLWILFPNFIQKIAKSKEPIQRKRCYRRTDGSIQIQKRPSISIISCSWFSKPQYNFCGVFIGKNYNSLDPLRRECRYLLQYLKNAIKASQKFPSYRNQHNNLQSKSIDWFLYEVNIGEAFITSFAQLQSRVKIFELSSSRKITAASFNSFQLSVWFHIDTSPNQRTGFHRNVTLSWNELK